MNNLELNTKINLGVKALLIVLALIMLHNASSILNNLGIITDLFIIIGVYQSGRFLTNKEIRTSVINKGKELIDFESFDGFLDNIIDSINQSSKLTEVEEKFTFSIDDMLNDIKQEQKQE